MGLTLRFESESGVLRSEVGGGALDLCPDQVDDWFDLFDAVQAEIAAHNDGLVWDDEGYCPVEPLVLIDEIELHFGTTKDKDAILVDATGSQARALDKEGKRRDFDIFDDYNMGGAVVDTMANLLGTDGNVWVSLTYTHFDPTDFV